MKQSFIKMVCVFFALSMLCAGFTIVTSREMNHGDTCFGDDSDANQQTMMLSPYHRIGCDEPCSHGSVFLDYPIGTIIWQYQITGSGYDFSPKAIRGIQDINGDDIDDVIVCSEDNNIRCFSGGALGAGVVLWTHNIYSGNIYSQNGLAIMPDVNNDGYQDLVVGATGGARLVRCISGLTGLTLWTYDTHEYGSGGWVYQVDCRFDYNNDGVADVLASTGDDSGDIGPKRVFCLHGSTGAKIWEYYLGGAGFSVIGVEDFTGDGKPDVVAGCTNQAETTGYAKGINGQTGTLVWSHTTAGSSVWAVEQIDDVSGDGIPDVMVGDFTGHIYGLNAANGAVLYSTTIGTVIITRFTRLDDVNFDGHPDIVPCHSTTHTTMALDGQTGNMIWSKSVADQPWNTARIEDISGDAVNDVVVGTLYQSNYVYFLNGVDGTELYSQGYGEAVDAIAAVPDAVGDGSMEMVAGGRNGKVVCFSGGLNASSSPMKVVADFTADVTSGETPLTVHFTDLSVGYNTTITSWEWDFDYDGVVDSFEQNPEWTYTQEGSYTVSLVVSDGVRSDEEIKVDYITVVPAVGTIAVGVIKGGFMKISFQLQNVGDTVLHNIRWTAVLDGTILFGGETFSGQVSSIDVGEYAEGTCSMVWGFGKISLSVSAVSDEAPEVSVNATGFLLLVFPLMR